MTVAALPGNVRFRAFQLGEQTAFGTPEAATRRLPWRFTPTVDPHWTFPDVDTGTLDQAIAPYRMASDITGQSTGPLAFNDAQILYAALLRGGVTPTGGGTAKTWDFLPSSESADDFELFTAEWGDEVAADQFQYRDGILSQLQLSYPQDLGPIMTTADWRFGEVDYPNAMTPGLDVDTNPTWAYAAHTLLYVDETAASIGITPLVNSVHDTQVTINGNPDPKRFQNGSNGDFALAGYGRGLRTIETTFTFGKSVPALEEAVNWLNQDPVQRFLCLDTTALTMAQASIPYQHKLYFSGYWFTRTEQAVNTNSAFQLVCQGVVDPDLPAPIRALIVNQMSTLAG